MEVLRGPAPKWEATFRFKVQDPTAQALRVVLYRPSRLFGHSELGWYEVPRDAEGGDERPPNQR